MGYKENVSELQRDYSKSARGRAPRILHPSNRPPELSMNYWDSLPDEVIIRVLLSLADGPQPILNFAQTSKRHNAIATDDGVWLPATVHIFSCFGIPSDYVDNDLLRQHRSRLLTHVQPHQTIYHQLYVRLFGPYRRLLGWWVTQDQAASNLCRVYVRFYPDAADGCICSIVGHPVISAFDTYTPPEDIHSAVRYVYSHNHEMGFYFVSLVDHPNGGIPIYGHNAARITYPEEQPDHREWLFEIRPSESSNDVPTPERKHSASRWDSATQCAITLPVDTSPWAEVNPESLSGRLLDSSTIYNDSPFPSPSAIFVVQGVRYDATTGTPIVPRATWDFSKTENLRHLELLTTPIHSPSYYPSETDELLATGIYTTPGATARRFVFLQTRSLTPADFVKPWPWDGHFGSSSRGLEQLEGTETSLDWTDPDVHLGPFSAVRCTVLQARFPRLTSEEYIRPGARIIEITKLAGQGVPRGQRTVVAFLQDPLVPPDQLADVQARLPLSHRDLPEERSNPPWPISRKVMTDQTVPSTTGELLQVPFEPESGIDLPAVGRVARGGFHKPSWLDVIVHVESRDRFTVYWQDIHYVEVFTKMNDV